MPTIPELVLGAGSIPALAVPAGAAVAEGAGVAFVDEVVSETTGVGPLLVGADVPQAAAKVGAPNARMISFAFIMRCFTTSLRQTPVAQHYLAHATIPASSSASKYSPIMRP